MESNKNYKGKRFGRLVVEEVVGKRSKSDKIKYFFLCRCDCGRTRNVKPAEFKRGEVFQCGYCGQEQQQSEAKEFSKNLKKSRMIEKIIEIMGVRENEAEKIYVPDFVMKPVVKNKALSKENYFYGKLSEYENLIFQNIENKRNEIEERKINNKQKRINNLVEKYSKFIGDRFGRVVIKGVEVVDNRIFFRYDCDCGNSGLCHVWQMTDWHKKSCGCIIQDLIDNKRPEIENALISVYYGMKLRCYNPKSRSYKYYGAENKTICDEWLDDKEKFVKWGIETGYVIEKLSNGYNKWTIERIDNNKGYSPENCRWATHMEQMQNQRPRKPRRYIDYNGEKYSVKEFSEKFGYKLNSVMWLAKTYNYCITDEIIYKNSKEYAIKQFLEYKDKYKNWGEKGRAYILECIMNGNEYYLRGEYKLKKL